LPECGGLTSRVGDELFQSVLTPRQVYWLIGLLLAVVSLVACTEEVAQTDPEEPHFYAEFDPAVKPWQPPEEKNYEEVFKNYQYYEIRYTNGGRTFTVKRIVRGATLGTDTYKVAGDGGLQKISTETPPQLGSSLYALHCVSCHGGNRLGGIGPALLPSNLGRLRKQAAADVIRNGRPSTQMPPFGKQLNDAAVNELVAYLYSPPEVAPVWGAEDIQGSHIVLHKPGSLPDRPVHDADPLNIFMVVEAGDHHVTVLDGDAFKPVHRFATRFALHGGLKYSPDGRYVYLASRDGWISKFDLHNLKIVTEVRAGINTRNVAVSGDGDTLLVGNYLPNSLVLLKAEDLSLIKVIPVVNHEGDTSRVSAVYQAAPRGSFIAALKDLPEVWEIKVGEPGYPVRKIKLERILDDFFFDQDYRYLIGADREQDGGQVIDLQTGKVVAALALPGMPHLGSGIIWDYQGKKVMATPNLKEGMVTVIDMEDWKVLTRIPTLGSGFFMRSHEKTPYAWTDVFFGPNKDAMHVIDKRTLKIVKTLRPEEGKTSGHVEFTRDGRYALVSIWEMDGALVIYDAESLAEVKRIPMRKPSGKYNVYNKIHRSAGTSH